MKLKDKKICIECKNSFTPKVHNQICCDSKCSSKHRKEYDLSASRKLKHQEWRQSKRGKEYMKEYNKTPFAKELRKIYSLTPKAKADRKRLDGQEYRRQKRRDYRHSARGREVFKMLVRNRAAKLNNVIHSFSMDEWLNKVESTFGICIGCNKYFGPENLTMDHIYPLSKANEDFINTGIKRVYSINDVMPLCRLCNSSKGNKLTLTMGSL